MPDPDWYTKARAEGRILSETGVAPTGPPETPDEKTFMAHVVRFAKDCGWKVYHTHDSRKSEAGFPDLVLVRERVIFAELKTDDGRLTAAQANWLGALNGAGVAAYEWRPENWPNIVLALRNVAPRTRPWGG